MTRRIAAVLCAVPGLVVLGLWVYSASGLAGSVRKRPAALAVIGACVAVGVLVCVAIDLVRRRKSN